MLFFCARWLSATTTKTMAMQDRRAVRFRDADRNLQEGEMNSLYKVVEHEKSINLTAGWAETEVFDVRVGGD